MEGYKSPEERESEIDVLIEKLAEDEGMPADDILSDIITFAPYEGNEFSNPDYIEIVAEKLGITLDEMNTYAIKKAEDNQSE